MSLTFVQIPQKTLETSGLHYFQLLPHGLHIGCERELSAVIEHQLIGWVDALQIELFAQRCSQRAKFRFVQQRHDKQSRTCIEMMSVAAEAIAASTGVRILFQNRNVEAVFGKMDGGGDPTDSRTDHDHRFWFH